VTDEKAEERSGETSTARSCMLAKARGCHQLQQEGEKEDMKRLDQSVYGLSGSSLESVIFQGSWEKTAIDDGEKAAYQGFLNLLKARPIRNKSICLVNPPQIDPRNIKPEIVEKKRYMDYPPTGLLYLASSIRHFAPDWSVNIVDLNLISLEQASTGVQQSMEKVLTFVPDGYDLYGVSMMFESWEPQVISCLEHLNKQGSFTVVGGVHGSIVYDKLLKNRLCDIVIKKEGETQLAKLIRAWQDAHGEQKSAQIIDEERSLVNLAYNKASIEDVEAELVEFPDVFENTFSLDIRKEYSLLDLDAYNQFGAPNIWTRIAASDRKWATMVANRGCRGKCTFCQVSHIMGQGVRGRSPTDIVQEILFLYKEHDVRHIEFVDDDFLAHQERAKDWLREVIDLNLDLTFSIGSGVLAILIDEEVAQLMSRAGCVMTGFGIESGNKKRLKSLRKPASLEKVKRGCDIFKVTAPDMWLQANFIVGFPDETYGELKDTFDYAKNLEIDYCQSSILRPIIGTPIYDELASIGDARIDRLDNFGGEKTVADTAGRDIVVRGLTFDDVFEDVIDFRRVDLEKKPNAIELQQFQIYFNSQINLIGSPNLRPGGDPEKIKAFTKDVLRAYPMDAVSWAVNAKACLLTGDKEGARNSHQECENALVQSRYWRDYFRLYDVSDALQLAFEVL